MPASPESPQAPESLTSRRSIVSFTRRGGRLNDRQQRAWDELADKHVIDVPRLDTDTSAHPDFELDLAQEFGREAPVVLEIGCGMGESLVHAASQNPNINFIGLEVYLPGIAQGLVKLRHEPLDNIRFAEVDAVPALSTMFPASSLSEVRIWFPDPWHKKRHNKRRLVTLEFASLVARVLKPGGNWRMATDWQEYADQMLEVANAAPDFDSSPTWAPRFEGRPLTRFETKGLAVGRTIRDIHATRR